MEITGLLTGLAVGLIIGALGRLVALGRRNVPIWLTLLAGVVAAALGAVLASVLGLSDTRGVDGIELVIQVALAAAGVGAVAATSGPRRADT